MSKPIGYVSKFTVDNHANAIEIYLKEIERIRSLNLYDYVTGQYYIDTVALKTGYSKVTAKKIINAYKNTLKQTL